ncbi:MAG: nucleotide exchange factor GrpE [Proteobacteria bacterium]|nr:nucleotide exchange factor GrpE [Pseudomonadota bacterium]MBU1715440.1 nucleotide exchange factor GrpE [Pseudomonadota bacterium]
MTKQKDKQKEEVMTETLGEPEEIGSQEVPEAQAGIGESKNELLIELENAKKEALANQDKLLRAAAEFENIKKRLQREKETSLKYAEECVLREILPAVDNLERALSQDQNNPECGAILKEGVEMTLKGLLSSLEKFGLIQMASVGKPFDPNFHEAMVMESSKEVPEQNILQEYEKGYLFKDRLLRAAKVVVSKGDV